MKSFFVSLILLCTFTSMCCAAEIDLEAALKSGEATKKTITPLVDGKELKVDWYVAPYLSKPNRPEDQLINIYVPENATKKSPVLFIVNNGGWFMNDYAATIGDRDGIAIKDGKNYMTSPDVEDLAKGREQFNAMALKRGFVVVSYGSRSRGNAATDGKYLGHSPATATDTKAAIRYLRANKKFLKTLDANKIVLNGTSGGGAMTALIAASGNSPDFFEYLYEVGAAGISKSGDIFISDPEVGDNVFATLSYCPITDLGNADAAYEFTYNETRAKLFAEGNLSYGAASNDEIMRRSNVLKARYADYVDSLKLFRRDGSLLTAENLNDEIIRLMKKEIEETISELGIPKMKADIENSRWHGNDWLVLNDDGTYEYDFEKHKYFVAMNQKLKIAPAFSNAGLYAPQQQNEDDLFGTREQPYSPFEFISWNEDNVKNSVGRDDTGLEWNDFIRTPAGQKLAKEIKMTCPFDYLTKDKNVTTAPNWYVRWGMKDRDSSFALETVFYHELLNSINVKNLNFEFAWLYPHSGNYDASEAFMWLDSILALAEDDFYAAEIDASIFSRIKGKSYKDNCVVPLEDLRYLHVLHIGFDGETHEGELICNASIAEDLLDIFRRLYEAKYQIEKIKLVDEYDADDERSMRDNNSSCFNFRFISHTTKVSKHGLGLAVDINTLYNPYVKMVDGKLNIEPATAVEYVDRSKDFPHKIDENDLCCKLFKEHGFEWGGDWKTVKDYQHFEK